MHAAPLLCQILAADRHSEHTARKYLETGRSAGRTAGEARGKPHPRSHSELSLDIMRCAWRVSVVPSISQHSPGVYKSATSILSRIEVWCYGARLPCSRQPARYARTQWRHQVPLLRADDDFASLALLRIAMFAPPLCERDDCLGCRSVRGVRQGWLRCHSVSLSLRVTLSLSLCGRGSALVSMPV